MFFLPNVPEHTHPTSDSRKPKFLLTLMSVWSFFMGLFGDGEGDVFFGNPVPPGPQISGVLTPVSSVDDHSHGRLCGRLEGAADEQNGDARQSHNDPVPGGRGRHGRRRCGGTIHSTAENYLALAGVLGP